MSVITYWDRAHSTALGPRIIPNFRDIINNCVSVLNDALKSNTGRCPLLHISYNI